MREEKVNLPAEEGSQQQTATPEQEGKKSSARSSVHSWVRDLIVSIAVSTFIIIFLYQPVRVEGTSMLPMLEDQDRLFVNKMAYRVGEIHRGDVVVFLYPHDHEKSYIKRVIALPGDMLKIDHGVVYVNGKQMVEK
ncbi:MAG TPA: signal peptidase I, partial [Edaphobacter sp.]